MRYDSTPGQSVVTFRKAILETSALLGMLVPLIGVIAGALEPHDHGVMFGAIPLTLCAYVLWLLARSSVRLEPDGVVVDNFLIRHVIPWHELAEIAVADGLVIRLRGGRKIGSIMYGGSVAGAILGYRYTRSVCAKMNAKRQEILSSGALRDENGTYRRIINFSPWPPLLMFAVLEALASLSLLR